MPFVNINLAILLLSIVIQTVNALLAVRLIRRTGNYLAGAMIISAVVLMAFRRTISLYRYVAGSGFPVDLAAESVALTISVLFLLGILYSTRLIENNLAAENENEKLISELRKALGDIRTLQGFLPICASCKMIRDEQGNWKKLEVYVSERSDAEFTHSICPECSRKLYPGIKLNKPDETKA